MDSPLAKKSEVMDMPIYLQFLDGVIENHRWFVIEEKSGVDIETADELGEELWILKSDQDRVRVVKLPTIGYDTDDEPLLVANSRLFLVGGRTLRAGLEQRSPITLVDDNGILYIDLQQRSPISWSRIESQDLKYVRAAVVSDDGDWIYVLTDKLLRFNCRHVEVQPEAVLLDALPGRSVASTGSKMLLYYPAWEHKPGYLGFYHLESRTWEEICRFPVDKDPFPNWLQWWSTTAVLVQNFLIDFGSFNPITGSYHPALYVFDICNNVWLPKPVQGLSNNGTVLPHADLRRRVSYTALMQVRRDELKFALVWSELRSADDCDEETEVHWSKFILRIQNNDADLPTFQAVDLSSATCYGGNTLLIKSTVG